MMHESLIVPDMEWAYYNHYYYLLWIDRYYSTYGRAIDQLDAVVRHTPSPSNEEEDFIIPFVGNGKVGSMVNYDQTSDSSLHVFVDSEDSDVSLVKWVTLKCVLGM